MTAPVPAVAEAPAGHARSDAGTLASRQRRRYLDWLRGVAVVVMIEAHTLDSWTLTADRQLRWYGWAMILGGFGAPLFLFLAGVAVAMSASAKVARGATIAAASAAVQRRGWEIFGLAFIFRLQAYVLGGFSSLRSLLKVDILNIMGPSIVAAAALWGAARSFVIRIAAFGAAIFLIAMITPIVRETRILDPLPAPIEAYLRPTPGLTNFILFPWAAFVFAGALVGLLIDRASDAESERKLIPGIAVGGALVAAAGYGASYLPSIYERSNFWTSSPTFFFLRTGLLTMAVAAAYAWEQTPAGRGWSPMAQLGRTSLFIYWIHIELVYGLIAEPIKRRLPFGWAIVAFLLFTVAMLGVSIVKTRVVERWRAYRKARKEGVR
ncbi:MAG: heparan-alpha-glucosaminide N-acetyltransferase domain-containing protein [Vicinamibacterales bacterium]